MVPSNYEVWKSKLLVEKYLSGVRGAIPLAKEQLEIMIRLIEASHPSVERFLDLGCGDGILANIILERYPNARGVLLDLSESMIQAAKEKLNCYSTDLEFIIFDYGNHNWVNLVGSEKSLDIIVSGFSIHHQPDNRKREIYSEIYGLLKPGGLFINIEHVVSPTKWIESVWDNYFVDSLFEMHSKQRKSKTREQIAKEYYNRSDREANILAPVEEQCKWLRKIGFKDVDCFFKVFELAIFGGRKV